MEGFLSPGYQKSAEIKQHHILQSLLNSRELDSVQGTLGSHHLLPPCCQTSELWSSGKKNRAGFPTAQLAVGSFSLSSLSRNCRSLSLASSHLILWVSEPCSQAEKIFLLHAKQKRASYKQASRLYQHLLGLQYFYIQKITT